VGPRAGLDGQKISSSPGFDPEPSSPVAIPTVLPGPHYAYTISGLRNGQKISLFFVIMLMHCLSRSYVYININITFYGE